VLVICEPVKRLTSFQQEHVCTLTVLRMWNGHLWLSISFHNSTFCVTVLLFFSSIIAKLNLACFCSKECFWLNMALIWFWGDSSRTDEVASGPVFNESPGLGVEGLEAARHLAIRNIDAFVLEFSNHQALLVPATSLAPAVLTQVAESAHIQEAGHLRCSGAEVGRFVAMLRNKAAVLRSCAAFALMQVLLVVCWKCLFQSCLKVTLLEYFT
jgi:hypothetical protein